MTNEISDEITDQRARKYIRDTATFEHGYFVRNVKALRDAFHADFGHYPSLRECMHYIEKYVGGRYEHVPLIHETSGLFDPDPDPAIARFGEIMHEGADDVLRVNGYYSALGTLGHVLGRLQAEGLVTLPEGIDLTWTAR